MQGMTEFLFVLLSTAQLDAQERTARICFKMILEVYLLDFYIVFLVENCWVRI